ncbi:hypothetical protein CCP3SC15_180032 [Gammaproteobacteria bacterium]
MALHYSTKDFFRQMPNALLARYFALREVLQDFDLAAIEEKRINGLFDVWLTLPEPQRGWMDGEFCDIFEMSCEKGFRASSTISTMSLLESKIWRI